MGLLFWSLTYLFRNTRGLGIKQRALVRDGQALYPQAIALPMFL